MQSDASVSRSTTQIFTVVIQVVDLERRIAVAQLHTAGHALADVVTKRFPGLEPFEGNHFPGGQAFVAFRGEIPDKLAFTAQIEQDLADLIERKAKVMLCPAAPGTLLQAHKVTHCCALQGWHDVNSLTWQIQII